MAVFRARGACAGLLLGLVGLAGCDDTVFSDDAVASGTAWTDPATGLTWEVEASELYTSWYQANDYCDALVLEGYEDWRLPSISELRTLVRGCEGTVEGGTCAVADDCAEAACQTRDCYTCVYGEGPDDGCFSISGLGASCEPYWSSTLVTDLAARAWAIGFSGGFIYKPRIYYSFHARCVR